MDSHFPPLKPGGRRGNDNKYLGMTVSIGNDNVSGKEGIHMRITQSATPIMKNAGVMALLCAFAQLALAAGLFWAFKAHIV